MKTIYIKDIQTNSCVELLCWISNKRVSKDLVFMDIYDSTGTLQAVASKENCESFLVAGKIKKESAVLLIGSLDTDNILNVKKIEIMADASFNLSPSPNESGFSALAKRNERQVIEHPTFYIRNHTLRSIYLIKSVFKRELQDYFWKHQFVEFESPTLTKQTLYNDDGAIWLTAEHQHISLSRCATFHLEPAVIAYEKVFTIANSHADEKVKTNRHLVEYTHLKAELCWVTLDELIELAGEMYYSVALSTYNCCKDLFLQILSEQEIEQKLCALNPQNHVLISYDEAVDILNEQGFTIEYGKSLTAKQEAALTAFFDEKFVWVKYIPYTVEGFMFKRKSDNPYLTMTCDLIAPNGYGEILGCAEKITDYDELLNSMDEKGKKSDFERYKDYAFLRKYGLPQHGGIGMGIERAVRYLLNVSHVKYVKPFAVVKGSQINH